jgi:two-component system, OmpR family, alkaline phosphatase synthesis response regulator PhoP
MEKTALLKGNILIVDDDPDILELLKFHFSNRGFRVSSVDTGEQALKFLKTKMPDLIILDIMLPGINGLDLIKILMNNPLTKNIPVIFLSAKNEEADIVLGMELGASDYVTKPFSVKELIARAMSLIRNQMEYNEHEFEKDGIQKTGDIILDPYQMKVSVNENSIELTPVEFNIFFFLVKNPGNVYSRKQIAHAIHGGDDSVTERSIDVQVYNLRKKLGTARDCIETIWRVGYRLNV